MLAADTLEFGQSPQNLRWLKYGKHLQRFVVTLLAGAGHVGPHHTFPLRTILRLGNLVSASGKFRVLHVANLWDASTGKILARRDSLGSLFGS